MSAPDHDPGIEHEPHVKNGGRPSTPDPTESKTDQTLEREAQQGGNDRLAVINSVTEEPFPLTSTGNPNAASAGRHCARCGYDMRGGVYPACPECGFDPTVGYAAYLKDRLANTPPSVQRSVFFLVLLTSGVLSVLGTLLGQFIRGTEWGLLAYAVSAPVYEELMKVMVVLMLIELRPYIFRYAWVIWVCTLGSAATFATLENLLYLNIYIKDPSAGIMLWRWTVCSALHVGCTAIVTVGLVRMWRTSIRHLRPPSAADTYPYMVAAMVVHGSYNALAVVFEIVAQTF